MEKPDTALMRLVLDALDDLGHWEAVAAQLGDNYGVAGAGAALEGLYLALADLAADAPPIPPAEGDVP